MSDSTRTERVPCPTCRESVPRSSKHFPFCSSRCRSADLQGWLDESYKIPGEPVRPEDVESADVENEDSENTE